MNHKKIWSEKKWVDVWSINHFLFGIISFYFLGIFGVDGWQAFFTAFFVYVCWEIIEKILKVGEFLTNQFMDIFFSVVGFGLFYLFPEIKNAMVLIIPIYVFLELYGYFVKFKLLGNR